MPGQLGCVTPDSAGWCNGASMAAWSEPLQAPLQYPMEGVLWEAPLPFPIETVCEASTSQLGDASAQTEGSTMRQRRHQQQPVASPYEEHGSESNASGTGASVQCVDAGKVKEMVRGLFAQLEGGSGQRESAIKTFRELAFKDTISSRAAQLALTEASSRDAAVLTSSLQGCVPAAVCSKHANHVIQKIVEVMPANVAAFVVGELVEDGADVARHRFGCRVLCRLLEHVSLDNVSEPSTTLFDKVMDEAEQLSSHKFGNYVIQHLVEFGSPAQSHRVANAIRKDLIVLSKDQFGSKVVERAVEMCCADDRDAIASELLSTPNELVSMAENRFGRFVVKSLLRTPGDHAEKVRAHLLSASTRLQSSRYGKSALRGWHSTSAKA